MKSFKITNADINTILFVFIANILFISNSKFLFLDNLRYDFKNILRIPNINEILLIVMISVLIALIYAIVLKFIEIKSSISINFLVYVGTVSIVLSTLRITGFSRLYLIINVLIVPIYITYFLNKTSKFINASTIIAFVISIIINNLNNDLSTSTSTNNDSASINSNLGIFESYYVNLKPNGNNKVENFNLFQLLIETNILGEKYLLERYSICCKNTMQV